MARSLRQVLLTLAALALVWALTLSGPGVQTSRAQGTTPPVLYVAVNGDCGGAVLPCYGTVQAAVDAAPAGGSIKVASGVYTDIHARATLTQVVYISKTLALSGGYTTTDWLTPAPEVNRTVLDAQGKGRVLYITGPSSPTIEGFHIKGGDASGLGGLAGPWDEMDGGGGIYLYESAAMLRQNRVYSNVAQYGGGIYVSASPIILADNVFIFNRADWGGGLYIFSTGEVVLRRNLIESNNASRSGGGLYLSFSGGALENNTLALNVAHGNGGGLYWGGSHASVQGITLLANVAAIGGGAFIDYGSSTEWVNSLIADNYAHSLGSGVYIVGASPQFQHTTLAHNVGGEGSGIVVQSFLGEWPVYAAPALTNTIVVGHKVGVSATAGNTVTLNGALWGTGAWANDVDWQGGGAIITDTHHYWGDPDFLCTAEYYCTFPYRIGLSSAALDRGIPVEVAHDLDGDVRPAGLGSDLGMDEYTPATALSLPILAKERLLLTFYYPWYHLDFWSRPDMLDTPLFPYSSNDASAINRHLSWLQLAGIDGMIVSWQGRAHYYVADNWTQLLARLMGTNMKATVYLETLALNFDSPAKITQEIEYMLDTYSAHPNFLHQDGRPVIFVYAADWITGTTAPPLQAWQDIVNTLHADGYHPFLVADMVDDTIGPTYLGVFDSLFTYYMQPKLFDYEDIANRTHQENCMWMASVAPGLDNRLLDVPSYYHTLVPRNDGQTYTTNFQTALQSDPDWLIVTSFNEWFENTHIEPGQIYGYDYLLYTADLAAQFHRWGAYATVYVDPAYDGPADGSAARPFRTLDDALFSAADGATVYLAGGDYPGPFTLTHSITLTGGYGPGWTPTTGVLPTVLRGNGAGPVVRIVRETSFYTPTVILDRVTLTGGNAAMGGGLDAQAADVTLRRVTVADNHAQTWGGGVAVQAGALRLDAAQLLRNGATVGGGFYAGPGAQVWLVNTLVAENAATFAGGGGYLHPAAASSIMDSTVTANTAPDVGGLYAGLWPSQSVNMHNSIVWGNAGRNLQCHVGCSVRYSDIEGGWPGLGNLDVAPRFADAAYHLAPDSPLVDAGGLVPPLPPTDLEGDPRLFGAGVDMGADEVNPVLMSSVSVTPQAVVPGSVLTYTVRLSNLGGRQTPFVITDTLSPLTRYIPGSASVERGTLLTPSISGTAMLPERIVWQGTIYSDEVLTLRFAATVLSATLEFCETITNEAVFRTNQATFARQAVVHRGPLERSLLTIEAAPGGGQPLVVTQTMTPGAVLPLYAAVYNGCGQYLGPLSAIWTTSGTLEAQTGMGARFDFSPTLVGSVGIVTAEAEGLHAQTGQLSVTAPPELALAPSQFAETQLPQTVHTYPLTLTNGNALSLTYVFTSTFVEPFEVTYTWDASFFANVVIVGRQAPLAHPEWSYYFAPEQRAPRFVGAQVAVMSLDMQVYGVNLGQWVNWDWEVFLSDSDMAFPEGQFLSTRANPFDSYVRTTPVWFAISLGERQTTAHYLYSASHNFETGETRVTPFLTGDTNSRSLPLAIQDGLHAQVFLWTGDSRVAQHFDGLRLTVRGVATYTTSSSAWLTARPAAGLIPPRSSEIVQVRADSHPLPLGTHTGLLWLRTNDPSHTMKPIPFSLTVASVRLHLPLILRAFETIEISQ